MISKDLFDSVGRTSHFVVFIGYQHFLSSHFASHISFHVQDMEPQTHIVCIEVSISTSSSSSESNVFQKLVDLV